MTKKASTQHSVCCQAGGTLLQWALVINQQQSWGDRFKTEILLVSSSIY